MRRQINACSCAEHHPLSALVRGIRTAITQADAVVFALTPDPVASKVCRTDLDYATETSK